MSWFLILLIIAGFSFYHFYKKTEWETLNDDLNYKVIDLSKEIKEMDQKHYDVKIDNKKNKALVKAYANKIEELESSNQVKIEKIRLEEERKFLIAQERMQSQESFKKQKNELTELRAENKVLKKNLQDKREDISRLEREIQSIKYKE